MEFDIRYSELQDGEHLKNWLMQPQDQKWFPMSTPQEVEDSSRNWIGFSKYRASLTAVAKGKPCGIATLFLMPYKKVSHHAMFYIIVDPNFRKKGIGTSLMKKLLNLAHNYFRLESVHTEVYEGCPLLSVLNKCGFEQFAYQENFVKTEEGYLARILLEHFF